MGKTLNFAWAATKYIYLKKKEAIAIQKYEGFFIKICIVLYKIFKLWFPDIYILGTDNIIHVYATLDLN